MYKCNLCTREYLHQRPELCPLGLGRAKEVIGSFRQGHMSPNPGKIKNYGSIRSRCIRRLGGVVVQAALSCRDAGRDWDARKRQAIAAGDYQEAVLQQDC
jgi:hypothetical protein